MDILSNQQKGENTDSDNRTETEDINYTHHAESTNEGPKSEHLHPALYDELSQKTNCDANQSENDDACSQLIDRPENYDDKDLKDTEKVVAPDGGWGWWCVIGCAFAHFFIGGFERSGGVFLLQLQRKFGGGAASTAWIVSLSATLRLLLGPLASVLSNKFSCRRVVIVGGLLFSLGVLISAFMPILELLYLSYGILAGLGKSFAYAPGLIIVGQYFKKRRSLAVGIATAGGGLGTLLLPPLIEILFEEYGYMGAFILLSGFPLHLCVCGSLYRSLEVKHKRKQIRSKGKENGDIELIPLRQKEGLEVERCNDHITSESSECDVLGSNVALDCEGKEKHGILLHKSLKNLKRKLSVKPTDEEKPHDSKKLIDLSLLKNSRFLTFCVGIGFLSLAFNSVLVFLPPVANAKGLSRLQGAGLLSVAGFFDTLGRFSSGVILNIKKISPFRMTIYNTAMFFLGFLTFSFPFLSTFLHFAVLGAWYGLLTGTYTSQKSVILADILGSENLNSSFGILICFQGIGTLLGPPVTGLIKDLTDSFDDGFYFVGCVTLIGACTLAIGNIYFYYRHPREIPETEDEKIGEC